jgi:hypothetical protein
MQSLQNFVLEYGNAGVAVSAGLLFGLITMLGEGLWMPMIIYFHRETLLIFFFSFAVQYVGLFMLGFHTGTCSSIFDICYRGKFITFSTGTGYRYRYIFLTGGFTKEIEFFESSLSVPVPVLYRVL